MSLGAHTSTFAFLVLSCSPPAPTEDQHTACSWLHTASKSSLHGVQHDLEKIADHVIIVKVQHEKAALDLQSAVLNMQSNR